MVLFIRISLPEDLLLPEEIFVVYVKGKEGADHLATSWRS